MKNRPRILSALGVLLCLGLPALWAWRGVRQERLDRELIAAVKHSGLAAVTGLLRQGANPNALVLQL